MITWRMALALVGMLIGADQVSKWLVARTLPFAEAVEVMPFLAFFYTHNDGIAFSFLAGMNDIALLVVTCAIILIVVWLWHQVPSDRWLAMTGFALVVGGAIGNFIDRLRLGHVVDFILLHAGSWSFAIFNLADSFITVGAGLIILDEFRRPRVGPGELPPPRPPQ